MIQVIWYSTFILHSITSPDTKERNIPVSVAFQMNVLDPIQSKYSITVHNKVEMKQLLLINGQSLTNDVNNIGSETTYSILKINNYNNVSMYISHNWGIKMNR